MSTAFTLKKGNQDVANFTVAAADLDANKEWVTDEFSIQNFSSMHVNIEYNSVDPDRTDPQGNTQPVGYQLEATVETMSEGGQWYPLASQLSGHNGGTRAKIREFIMQPDLVNVDSGVEHVIFSGFGEKARIVREQGNLGSKVRVRITCVDLNNGATPFASTNVSIHGILY